MMTAQTINEMNDARTLANIARRAQTLFADGYTAREGNGFWYVNGPEGQTYFVFTGNSATGEHCNCPAFAKHGECKHHLAVADEVAQAEALGAQCDAQAELTEGCYAVQYARY